MKKVIVVLALSLFSAIGFYLADQKEQVTQNYEYNVISDELSEKGLYMLHTAADVSSEEEVRDLLQQIQSDYQEEMEPAQSMFVMVDDLEGHLVSQSQMALDEVGKIHTSLDELFTWNVIMY